MRALLVALVVSIGGCGAPRMLVTKADRFADVQVASQAPVENRFEHDRGERRR
jgi:hypothetical protein